MQALPYAIGYLLAGGGVAWAASVIDHAKSNWITAERILVGGTAFIGGIYVLAKVLEKGS